MTSRAVLAVIAAALIFGAIGYYYGISDPTEEPYAAPATIATVAAVPPSCRALATLTYDATATPPLSVSPKPITVFYPSANRDKWAVCWTLVVKGDNADPFSEIRLTGVSDVAGQGGQPVLKGDTNFKGRQIVSAFFNDEPDWGTADEILVSYGINAKLRGSTTYLSYDPDIVIQKPGG